MEQMGQGNSVSTGNDEIEIDLVELFGALLRHIWLILAAGIFGALVCFVLSYFVIAPTYESTTKIYILNKQNETSVTYSDVQLGTQLTKDYAELINSRFVLEEVIQSLGLALTYEDLLDKIEVDTPTDTRIVAIAVADHDPVLAMNIANAVREAASEHIQNVMDIEAVNVVETANMPTEKAGPKVLIWTIVGALIMVCVICGIVIVRFLVDDTIKTSDDVEKYLGLSTLALIPIAEDENGSSRKKKRA